MDSLAVAVMSAVAVTSASCAEPEPCEAALDPSGAPHDEQNRPPSRISDPQAAHFTIKLTCALLTTYVSNPPQFHPERICRRTIDELQSAPV